MLTMIEKGKVPLHHAAWAGDTEGVKVLLAAGCAINPLTIRGQTPLHFAAGKGRDETLAALLAYDAGPVPTPAIHLHPPSPPRRHWWRVPTPCIYDVRCNRSPFSRFVSKLPLPRYADVRLHIPMPHINDMQAGCTRASASSETSC